MNNSQFTAALRKNLTPHPTLSAPIQWGVVHAVHTSPNAVDLYLDGTQTYGDTAYLTVGVRYLSSYSPTVGDTVVVSRGTGGSRSDRFVLGKLA